MSCRVHSRQRPRSFEACLVVMSTLFGCVGRDTPIPRDLDEVVRWVDTITLEESADVINVWPVVRADPRGGFLVADGREAQFRRYGPRGELLAYFGRQGDGPSEFRVPAVAVRLASGEILAADLSGRIVMFDSAASSVVRVIRTMLTRLDDMVQLDDSLVLLAGSTTPDSPRIHALHLGRDSVVRSFFEPWGGTPHTTVAVMAGWTSMALRHDTVAAIFAPSDTVYLFYATTGEPVAQLPIPSDLFRRPTALPEGARRDARARTAWMSTFDLVASVWWAPPDRLIVPYQTFIDGEPRWRLLGMSRGGRLLFDVAEAPRLLAVGAREDKLYFVSEGSMTPDHWSVAVLR